MMIRLRWLLLLFLSSLASAQFTTVTGTVTDPNSVPYANGTITAQLVLAGTTPTINGGSFSMTGSSGLDKTGSFIMRLADSLVMMPNANWSFTVCSGAGTVQPAGGTGPQCFTPAPITITGASQSITAQLHAAALALTTGAGGSTPAAPPNSAQYNNAGALGGVLLGAGQLLAGTAAAPVAQAKVTIDVRDFGAVPDGATDNAAAFTSAFTAANAVTTGSPTVLLGCNSASATCQYNYSGAGLSAINLLIPMTLQCAPGVYLNYTGTAHAVEIGPTTLTQIETRRYKIEGCTFTGGANYTAGLWVNNWIANTMITHNVFRNFGNQTAYTIVFNGNDWTPTVQNNYWSDSDGFSKNMVDAHVCANCGLLFVDNKNECETAGGTACSVATVGVGLWVASGWIIGNEIKYHYPAVRFSSCQTCGSGQGLHITRNLFEGNNNGLSGMLTFGDPNTNAGAGIHMGGLVFTDNFVFWPLVANVSIVTNEPASVGNFILDSSIFKDNLLSPAPSGTGKYINTNFGVLDIISSNHATVTSDLDFTTASMTDANNKQQFTLQYRGGNSSALAATSVLGMDAAGHYIDIASYHQVSFTLKCSDVSGSGTTQACTPTPNNDSNGTQINPAAGDCLIYTTTTTNTGALTLNVNGSGAKGVQKRQGTVALAAGDLVANHNTLICYDGTNWDLLDPITQ